METTASIPEILIPATPAPTGAGPAPVRAPAAQAPGNPAQPAPPKPEGESEFSNTFNSLQEDSATEDPLQTRPPAASGSPVVAATPPVSTALDTQLSLAATGLEAPAADLAADLELPTTAGNGLPPGGEALPVAPNMPGNAAEPTGIALLNSQRQNLTRGDAMPVTMALPADSADASAKLPAAAEVLTAATAGSSSAAASATGLPANLLLAKGRPGATAADTARSLPEVVTDGLKAPADNAVQSLRNLLLQAAPGESPRIALPQFADGSLATSMAQPPASATAAFTDTLSQLMPSTTGQQTLQPAGDRGMFAQGLGERLVLMADNGQQSARIKLYPEHLGPLDIRVKVDDDVAKVWFHAQHGQTRDALEQALPRLREMFAEQGLQLVRSEVADAGEGLGGGTQEAADADHRGHHADTGEEAVETSTPIRPPGVDMGSARLLDVMA